MKSQTEKHTHTNENMLIVGNSLEHCSMLHCQLLYIACGCLGVNPGLLVILVRVIDWQFPESWGTKLWSIVE